MLSTWHDGLNGFEYSLDERGCINRKVCKFPPNLYMVIRKGKHLLNQGINNISWRCYIVYGLQTLRAALRLVLFMFSLIETAKENGLDPI